VSVSARSLDWYPKRFAPGDMDGNMNDGLLGKTELSPLEILIRETAQNSWDARIEGLVPEYGVNLRQPDPGLNQRLAELLPLDHVPHFAESLLSPDAPILEISDRNTVGLDGPVDMEPVAVGTPKNFEDLIFKVGVPRSDGQGGGTFGFGKTAAFNYSELGVVVYWTRCKNSDQELEHRFIVSAFTESYVADDVQYTGRHWWGRIEDSKILPVQGEAAEALGNELFVRGFGDEQTGTSLLVLVPRIGSTEVESEFDGEEERLGPSVSDSTGETNTPMNGMDAFASQARRAIRRHLWPKLVPGGEKSEAPMTLSLEVGGTKVDLVDSDSGALELWGMALNALRQTSPHQSEPSTVVSRQVKTDIVPIIRLSEVLGHLAIVHRNFLLKPQLSTDDLDPAEPSNYLGRVALMRGATELVVATEDWGVDSLVPMTDWLAVFRSTPDFDPIFAASEPPAHDSWVSSGSRPDVKRVVTAMKKMINRRIAENLGLGNKNTSSGPGNAERTAGLSRRLGSVLPVEVPRDNKGRGNTDKKDPKPVRSDRWRVADQVCNFEGTAFDGTQMQRVRFRVEGPGPEAMVDLQVSVIGDQGVTELLSPAVLQARWSQDVQALADGSGCRIGSGSSASVLFNAPHRRALRIELLVTGVE
jgi:hypothetical protein